MVRYSRPLSLHSGKPIDLTANQSQGWLANGEAGYPDIGGKFYPDRSASGTAPAPERRYERQAHINPHKGVNRE